MYILHNMIIEDECDDNEIFKSEYEQLDENLPELSCYLTTKLMKFIQHNHKIRNTLTHHQLQLNIIKH